MDTGDALGASAPALRRHGAPKNGTVIPQIRCACGRPMFPLKRPRWTLVLQLYHSILSEREAGGTAGLQPAGPLGGGSRHRRLGL